MSFIISQIINGSISTLSKLFPSAWRFDRIGEYGVIWSHYHPSQKRDRFPLMGYIPKRFPNLNGWPGRPFLDPKIDILQSGVRNSAGQKFRYRIRCLRPFFSSSPIVLKNIGKNKLFWFLVPKETEREDLHFLPNLTGSLSRPFEYLLNFPEIRGTRKYNIVTAMLKCHVL